MNYVKTFQVISMDDYYLQPSPENTVSYISKCFVIDLVSLRTIAVA